MNGLENDISETRDLSLERLDIAARLRESLEKWQREIGAVIPERNPLWPGVENNAGV